MSPAFFTREQIRALLVELGADLERQGLRAEMFIVGGAALALAFNTRRTTRDIDGIFEPKREVYESAARIAARHGIPDDWLNDAVKGLLPGLDPDAREVLAEPGIRVSVPSARYLLAMKVAAARVDRDADDIRYLAGVCGAHTAEEVLQITEQVIGDRRTLLPKAQYLVEAMFPAIPPVIDQPEPEASLRGRVSAWLSQRRAAATERAAQRPVQQISARPKPPRMGRCGAPTQRGGRCRNQAGSCPNHR